MEQLAKIRHLELEIILRDVEKQMIALQFQPPLTEKIKEVPKKLL